MSGKRLKEHAPGLWTALGQADVAYPKFFQKFDFSTRMTVVRLSDGGLCDVMGLVSALHRDADANSVVSFYAAVKKLLDKPSCV